MASIPNSFKIVYMGYGDSYRPEARLDCTLPAECGKVAGLYLTGGEIVTLSTHGECVRFGYIRNAAALKGKVPKGSDVTVVVKGKPDVEVLMAEAKAAVAAELARVAAEAATLRPIGYQFEAGCDSGDRHRILWPEGASDAAREIARKAWPTELVDRHVTLDELRAIAEATGAEAVEPTMATYGGHRYGPEGLARLFELARERADGKRARTEAKEASAAARVEASAAEAKALGKPVIVSQWTEDCNDPREECDLDSCTRWVNPDGTFKVTRRHTH